MKLASIKSGRDGALVVVNNSLTKMACAGHIATTMQDALDDWANVEPKLQALSVQLENGEVETADFDQTQAD